MKQRFWVVKSETFNDNSAFLFIDLYSEEQSYFNVGPDLKELKQFLKDNKKADSWYLGFDNLRIESQIIEYILITKSITVKSLYQKLSFTKQNNPNAYRLTNNNVDIAVINHWIYGKKHSELHKIQNNIHWPNLSLNKIINLYDYLINETRSIKEIIKLSDGLLKLRTFIQAKYNFSCLNMSNTTIGSELLLDLYCKRANKKKSLVSNERTSRNGIKVKDIIFKHISFKSTKFKTVLEEFKSLVLYKTKDAFKYEINFKGNIFTYGLGGIHQVKKHSIFKEDKDYIIIEADVISQHPYIASNNNIFPAHLDNSFSKLLKSEILDPRFKEKKKENGNVNLINGLKECALSIYGNSNNPKSWLYDPQFTMQIAINSQLMLSMLIESLFLNIKDLELILTNTDGIILKLKRKDIDIYKRICSYWSKTVKLELEYTYYSKMFVWDANNYIADGVKPKAIGRLQINKFIKNDVSVLHKNRDALIIAKGVTAYFLKNTKPESYINHHKNNIYDFCFLKKRLKDGWDYFERFTDNGKYGFKVLNHDIRFFVTLSNKTLIKKHEEGKEASILEEEDKLQLLNNNDIENYNINYQFYIDKIYEQIKLIEPTYLINDTQLKLF